MTAREKKLIAALVFMGVLVAIVRVVPAYFSYVKNSYASVVFLRNRIIRYEKLLRKYEYWQEQSEETIAENILNEKKLFVADTPELISARMQGTLKRISRASGVVVKSMSLPEFLKTDDWLLTTQNLAFESSSKKLMNFLDSLQKSRYYLPVVKLDVRSSGKGIAGVVKLVGFSRKQTERE